MYSHRGVEGDGFLWFTPQVMRKILPRAQHPVVRMLATPPPELTGNDNIAHTINQIASQRAALTDADLATIAERIEAEEDYSRLIEEFHIGPITPYVPLSELGSGDISKAGTRDAAAFCLLWTAISRILTCQISEGVVELIRDLIKVASSKFRDVIADTILFLISDSRTDTDVVGLVNLFFAEYKGHTNGYLLCLDILQEHVSSEKPLDSMAADILLVVLEPLLKENDVFCSGNLFNKLIGILNCRIAVMDPIAINFLVRIGTVLKREVADQVFVLFPSGLVDAILREPPFLHVADLSRARDAVVVSFREDSVTPMRHCAETVTFGGGFDIQDAAFEYQDIVKDIIMKRRIVTLADLMVRFAKQKGDSSLSILESIICTLATEYADSAHLYDILVVYVYIFRSLGKERSSNVIFDAVFESGLFDPRITIFEKGVDTIHVFQARSYVLHSLLQVNANYFPSLLTRKREYPLLIAEMCCFLRQNVKLLDSVAVTSKFLDCLRSLALGYQQLDINSSEYRQEIEIARRELLTLISMLFSQQKIARMYQSSPKITSIVISHLYEESMRDFILNSILPCYTDFAEIAPHIVSLCHYASSCMTETRNLALLNDVLGIMNSLSQFANNFESFRGMEATFINAMRRLKPGELSIKVICNIIGYLSVMARETKPLPDTMEAISWAIATVSGNDPPEQIYKAMLGFLAGVPECYSVPNFLIPANVGPFVSDLVNIFINSPKVINLLKFFQELCVYSKMNAYAFHSAYLDIYLLREVDLRKMDRKNEEFIIESIELVKRIAIHCSSLPVLVKFIALLCPSNGRTLCDFHTVFLKTLEEIILVKRSFPVAYLPVMCGKPVITTKELKLSNHMAMIFWVSLSSLNNNFCVCSITDNLSRVLKIQIVQTDVCVTMNGETKTVPVKFPKDTYFPLCVYFEKSELNCNITISLWNTDPVALTFESCDFDKNIHSLRVGGTDSPMTCASVGPFAIYRKMSNVEMTAVIERGIRRRVLDNALISVVPDIENSFLTLNAHGSAIKSAYDVRLDGAPTVQHLSLAEVIVRLCKVEALLPLYAELDFETRKSHAADITQLISTVLSVSGESGQAVFRNSSGTMIIAYLLKSSDSRHVTCELYQKLIDIVGVLSDQELLCEWIDHLILNFEVLAHAYPEQQARITKTKLCYFVSEHKELCNQVRPFSAMLATMQSTLPSDGSEARMHVRANVIDCCLTLSDVHFGVDDARFLVATLIELSRADKISETQELFELLFMLMTDRQKMKLFTVSSVLYILVCGSDRVCIRFLDFFKRINEATQNSFVDCVRLFPSLLRIEPSDEFFEGLLSLISDFPPLAFLAFHLSFKHGGRFAGALKTLPRGNKYPSSIWPLCLGWSLIDEEIGTEIIRTIAKNALNGTEIDLIASIFFIYQITSVDYHKVMTICLTTMLEELLSQEKKEKEHIRVVVNLCVVFMFFKPESYISNQAFHFTFENSPFCEGGKCDLPSHVLNPEFHRIISHPSTKPFRLRFGVGLDKNSEWMDHELGIQCMQAMADDPDAAYRSVLVLLSYCQNRTESVESREMFDNVIRHFASTCDKVCEVVLEQTTKRHTLSGRIEKETSTLIRTVQETELAMFQETQRLHTTGKIDGEKKWRHLFSRLSQNRAPWHLLSERKEVHMKRDDTMCYGFAPMKQKINNDFHSDSYEYASLCRDTGSFETAQAIMEKRKSEQQQELLRKYSNDIPALCDISVEIDEEKGEKDAPRRSKHHRRLGPLDADVIKCGQKRKSRFTVYRHTIEIDMDPQVGVRGSKDKPSKCVILPVANVVQILQRYISLRPRGIEIITDTRKSYLISFQSHTAKSVLDQIKAIPTWQCVEIQTADQPEYFKTLGYTERWANGEISTFEYLCAVNFFSGRSFHDCAMYPVFPWVLRDYESSVLDLADPKSFRNLELPMGGQDPARLADLRQKREDLSHVASDTYLYSCGFSSPLTVFLFLLRTEPFTGLHIEAQGGRFDHASRLFTSIGRAYVMACTQNNDFRELIPEFFYDQSFLINSNNYNLGSTIKGKVGNVELPPWASTPMDFIYMHRKALESQYVSEHLHTWLDFMFGVRQHDDLNDFHGKLYESAWEMYNEDDPFVRAEIEAIMQNCGQIPKQMFMSEHPKRVVEKITASTASVVDIKMEHVFALAGFESCNDTTLRLYGMTENGGLYCISCPISPHPQAITEKMCQVNTVIPTLAVCESGKVLIATQLGVVYLFDSKGYKSLTANGWHTGRVNCIAVDGSLAATGGNDTITNIVDVRTTRPVQCEIPSFTDAVVSVAVSKVFGLCVSGTRDGTVFVRATTSLSTVRSVDIGRHVPEKILITPSWGFIVVYSTRNEAGKLHSFLSLYTVNGEEIRGPKEIPCQIACWTSFVSRDGFDYVIFCDTTGKAYLFEAFYLDIGTPFHDCWTNVLDIKYLARSKVIAAITKDSLWMIPFPSTEINV